VKSGTSLRVFSKFSLLRSSDNGNSRRSFVVDGGSESASNRRLSGVNIEPGVAVFPSSLEVVGVDGVGGDRTSFPAGDPASVSSAAGNIFTGDDGFIACPTGSGFNASASSLTSGPDRMSSMP
jgi:hypothetical protein